MRYAKYVVSIFMAGTLFAQSSSWRPYQFIGTEHMKYEITNIKDSKTEKGEYTIDIKKEGEKFRIELKGRFGESSGSFSTTVENTEDIPQALMGQMFFNPWMAPLSVTLFSPFFTMFFLSPQWEGKSHWKQTDEEGNVTEVNFGEECEFGGFVGKHFEVLTNGNPNYEVCVSEDVPLPLYIKFSEPDENSVFEVKLIEFSSK